MKRKELGQYIVSDPRICHGALTFKGTRILVSVVLDMIARGMDWDDICREYHNHITKDHIAEAVRLAKEALSSKRPPVAFCAILISEQKPSAWEKWCE
jgi:uncharacterized protein (DUF433 family)